MGLIMKQVHNIDKVLWDSKDGTSTIFVTEGDGLGVRVSGRVNVMTPKAWLSELDEMERLRCALGQARARISKLEGYIADKTIQDYKK